MKEPMNLVFDELEEIRQRLATIAQVSFEGNARRELLLRAESLEDFIRDEREQ
jgi:hypothetical protein